MGDSILCGYELASRCMRLSWADLLYEGYDREYFLEVNFDPTADDGTELWRLQRASLDRVVYFTTADIVRVLRDGFARWGRQLDVLRIRLDVEDLRDPDGVRHLPRAEDSPDARFEVIGYDAGWLMGRHSIIFQPGFMTRMDAPTRGGWAARLNEHGLFARADDCRQFRDLFYQQEERESGEMEILEVAILRE